jgi:hypothetical protein
MNQALYAHMNNKRKMKKKIKNKHSSDIMPFPFNNTPMELIPPSSLLLLSFIRISVALIKAALESVCLYILSYSTHLAS